MAHTSCLVGLISTVKARKKSKNVVLVADITNLKQCIFTFDIYGNPWHIQVILLMGLFTLVTFVSKTAGDVTGA
jgi:hypothetical protein